MVLIEAFATATPVVASDIAGFADVATPEAARLVPPADQKALADAICELLANEDRRVAMGRAGRELAERYSWAGIAARLEAIYERAVA
jgi:glycosyltransferase involved in cell wall biosynthesis